MTARRLSLLARRMLGLSQRTRVPALPEGSDDPNDIHDVL
jgi:hypothetical protein